VLPYICKAITGLPELKGDHEGVCNGCAQGKNIKKLFRRKTTRQKGPSLIHSNVCGPNIHDDYPPLVFSKFKEFKALIENLSERKIKILRSDNGGEYTSKEFVNFCKYVGINRELTTPYNPQQNGVAE
jgi:transposase InsO family protein